MWLAHQAVNALGGAVAFLCLLADADAIDRGQRGLSGGGKSRNHQRHEQSDQQEPVARLHAAEAYFRER